MGIIHAKPGRFERKYQKSQDDNIKWENVDVRVDKISISGLRRSKDDFITALVQELFTSINFQELLINAANVKDHLEKTGCFRSVSIAIDTSSGPNATKNGVEVSYSVNEYGRVTGGVSTTLGNNEASLLMGLRGPNLLGRGEKLQFEYSVGSRNSSNMRLSLAKPIWQLPGVSTSGSLFQQNQDYPESGCNQTERGFHFDVNFAASEKVKHKVQYEATWREVNILRNAAFEVREEAGHSLKSSVKHVIDVDQRDYAIFPSRGYYASLSNELAGLGGNIGFFKSDLYTQINIPLPRGLVLQATSQLGFLHSVFENKSIGISDRFFLGGPMNFRGFKLHGIGPQVDRNFLGATHSWGAGLHLFSPLPFMSYPGGFGDLFRLHLFTTLGNLENTNFGENFNESLKSLFQGYRLSYGWGLAIRLSQMARIEINYAIPLYYRRSDLLSPGLQFGVGVLFL